MHIIYVYVYLFSQNFWVQLLLIKTFCYKLNFVADFMFEAKEVF